MNKLVSPADESDDESDDENAVFATDYGEYTGAEIKQILDMYGDNVLQEEPSASATVQEEPKPPAIARTKKGSVCAKQLERLRDIFDMAPVDSTNMTEEEIAQQIIMTREAIHGYKIASFDKTMSDMAPVATIRLIQELEGYVTQLGVNITHPNSCSRVLQAAGPEFEKTAKEAYALYFPDPSMSVPKSPLLDLLGMIFFAGLNVADQNRQFAARETRAGGGAPAGVGSSNDAKL